MAGARVMIVEDDEDLRELLELLLAREGYEVITAEHGAAALARLEALEDLPAVILLDLMMPVLDGAGFRARQRADARLAQIPIILLSGDQGAAQGADLEPAAIIHKPMHSIEPLLERVRALCPP